MSRLRLKQIDDKIESEKCKIYIQGMKQKPLAFNKSIIFRYH